MPETISKLAQFFTKRKRAINNSSSTDTDPSDSLDWSSSQDDYHPISLARREQSSSESSTFNPATEHLNLASLGLPPSILKSLSSDSTSSKERESSFEASKNLSQESDEAGWLDNQSEGAVPYPGPWPNDQNEGSEVVESSQEQMSLDFSMAPSCEAGFKSEYSKQTQKAYEQINQTLEKLKPFFRRFVRIESKRLAFVMNGQVSPSRSPGLFSTSSASISPLLAEQLDELKAFHEASQASHLNKNKDRIKREKDSLSAIERWLRESEADLNEINCPFLLSEDTEVWLDCMAMLLSAPNIKLDESEKEHLHQVQEQWLLVQRKQKNDENWGILSQVIQPFFRCTASYWRYHPPVNYEYEGLVMLSMLVKNGATIEAWPQGEKRALQRFLAVLTQVHRTRSIDERISNLYNLSPALDQKSLSESLQRYFYIHNGYSWDYYQQHPLDFNGLSQNVLAVYPFLRGNDKGEGVGQTVDSGKISRHFALH